MHDTKWLAIARIVGSDHPRAWHHMVEVLIFDTKNVPPTMVGGDNNSSTSTGTTTQYDERNGAFHGYDDHSQQNGALQQYL